MSVTLTYESTLSRVRVDANGFDANAITAQVERSLDQVTWTTVRCGLDAPIVSGAVTIYDYEFTSDVVNYYRAVTPNDPIFVSAGAAAHANNTSVNPALPAGLVTGDLLLVLAAIRNSGVGTVDQPVGYTTLIDGSNVKLFGKLAEAGEVAPTVTFAGGVANASTSAQTAAFRDVELNAIAAGSNLNASAQDVAVSALSFAAITECLNLWIGWKQDDWTSVAPVASGVEIGEPSTTLGDDQGVVWNYRILTPRPPFTSIGARTFVVTGGAAAISRGGVLALRPSDQVQTSSITPSITSLWLKSMGKPFLNRSFACVPNISNVERGERTGLFEVLGRSFPVAVTDLRQSREVTIELITRTEQEHVDLDFILALGEPMFVHTPAHYPLPTMHVVVNRTTERRPLRGRPCGDDWRVFTLPLREVAAPGVDVCGSTVTWQSVVNSFATWQSVLNVETSWFDLLQNVGAPSDVIVP